jgi:hypothetical protein
MHISDFSFGTITIDGARYDRDVVIENGKVRKRKKKPSKALRGDFGHTPLSLEERIPWSARRLIVGTGASGAMPVMDAVKGEARRRDVELVILPTAEAIRELERDPKSNAILHVTC